MDVARRWRLPCPAGHPDRPAQRDDDAHRLRGRSADRRLLDRLHGRRRRGAALLRLHGPVRLLDAAARPVGELRDPARRVGPRRALVVPADRVPPRAAERRRGRQEGVHHERLRRRHHGARDLPALLERSLARARRLRLRGGHLADRHDPGGAGDARRRGGEVGAAPAAHLASRRDGGPDPGQRADPRGHDGHRRRLPARPAAPDLRVRARGAGPGRRDRRGHAARRRADRARPGRHQARDRLLDDVPDRLHVPRRRARRLRERDVPPDDARLLQGAALPRGRDRHPCAPRRAGHAQHGRPPPLSAEDANRLPDRGARAGGHAAALGLLVEGLDPRRRPGGRLVRPAPAGGGPRRRFPDRSLHVPDVLPRVRGRSLAVREGAHPRPRARPRRRAVLDGFDGVGADRAGGDRRVDPDPRRLAPAHGLARAGRRAARRAERAPGLRHERCLGRPRAGGDRSRVGDLRQRSAPARPRRPSSAACSSASSTSTRPTTGFSTGRRSSSPMPGRASSSGR